MNKIPLVIPVFNQLTYLRNIINWWKYYYPENPVYIVDNGSSYDPLSNFYSHIALEWKNITLIQTGKNDFIGNLTKCLEETIKPKYEYYVISDCDIQPHPATPPNFLEVWKNYIDNHNFHRAGFSLITYDIPDWIHDRDWIQGNEKELLNNPVLNYGTFIGYRAPIDTTFCLYKTANGGWSAPMNGKDWSNCLRLFDAFHLGWYQHPDFINPEMDHYFSTCKRHDGGVSAGKNNNRPKKYSQ